MKVPSYKSAIPEWRRFEELVSRIEADAGPLGLIVVSPDRIRCKFTGRFREVDASIRAKVGTTDILVTIECRRRGLKQDVTWIEQLATKKQALGASRTIAVSSSGFSREAIAVAQLHGIDLRELSEVSAEEINKMMRLDFVLFTHKRSAPVRVSLRSFREDPWLLPDPSEPEILLPETTNLFVPIFRNLETGATWSINDLWFQLQNVTDPFTGLEKGSPPVVRTVCFPYPGNVSVETPNGEVRLGDVLLSLSLWLELEQVDLESAHKVEYKAPSGEALQRLEFVSTEPGAEDWRITLQMPKNCSDLRQLRVGGNWPMHTSKRDETER
ncbi:MAG: restriction endonuclease [Desulfosporosinus sp.]|nr:restriction endonuclease [Desulfosporosinus sp.]